MSRSPELESASPAFINKDDLYILNMQTSCRTTGFSDSLERTFIKKSSIGLLNFIWP